MPIRLNSHLNLKPMVETLAAATISTAGAVTYTAAQVLGGLILRDPNGGARTDVTPTAALLVAEMPIPGRATDATFSCYVINTADASEVLTVSAGSNVTLKPATVTLAQNENALLLVRFTSVAPGSETVTIYAMVAGG